jgi:hypothetical protein
LGWERLFEPKSGRDCKEDRWGKGEGEGESGRAGEQGSRRVSEIRIEDDAVICFAGFEVGEGFVDLGHGVVFGLGGDAVAGGDERERSAKSFRGIRYD